MARKSKGDAGRAAAPKQPRAKKAEVRTVDEDGIEEVKGGLSFDDGIVLTTTLALIGAIVLVVMAGGRYAV
jgi:hypothetical protein